MSSALVFRVPTQDRLAWLDPRTLSTARLQEFWVQMSLKIDPAYQVVLAVSDDAPLASGQWLQGVYTFHNGVLISGPGT